MSVKTLLPLLGVGSAFAILGLCAARRPAKPPLDGGRRPGAPRMQNPRMQSGVHPRVRPDDADAAKLGVAATSMGDFWDAAPESYLSPDSYGRPASEGEAYDALDPEDLSAEWLSRATEAPPRGDDEAFDLNDPAEIAADSMSMISDASRHAARDAHDVEPFDVDVDDGDDLDAPSRG